MIRVVAVKDYVEIWRKGKHRIHLRVTTASYERLRKLLFRMEFTFYPTNYKAGFDALSS